MEISHGKSARFLLRYKINGYLISMPGTDAGKSVVHFYFNWPHFCAKGAFYKYFL